MDVEYVFNQHFEATSHDMKAALQRVRRYWPSVKNATAVALNFAHLCSGVRTCASPIVLSCNPREEKPTKSYKEVPV